MKLKILLVSSLCFFFISCSQEKEIKLSKNCRVRYVLDKNENSVLAIEILNGNNSTKINYISEDCFSFFVGTENNICRGIFGDDGFSGQITNSKDNCVVNKTENGLVLDANTEDGYRAIVEYNEDLLKSKHYDSIKEKDVTYFVTEEDIIKIE